MTTPCITSRSLARIIWYLRGDADLAVVVVGGGLHQQTERK